MSPPEMQWLIDIVFEMVMNEIPNLVSINEIDPDECMFIHGIGGAWDGVTGSAARDAIGLGTGDTVEFNQLHLNFAGSQDYWLVPRVPSTFCLQSQVSGLPFQFEMFTKDGDGTDYLYWRMSTWGSPSDITDLEDVACVISPGVIAEIRTFGRGSGSTLPLDLYCSPLNRMLRLMPDGDKEIGQGPLDFQFAMGSSSKDPTTDAPVDWVEIKIGGTTRYLPAYTA